MNLIKHLKSNNFAIWIAIVSVLVQSFHSYTVFYRISTLNGTVWGIIQAVAFAAIIDLAILFYTVRKNVKVTWMAGFVMVLINCYYYYSHLGLGLDLVLGGLLSLVIPVSVYYYSEEIHEDYPIFPGNAPVQKGDQWKISTEPSQEVELLRAELAFEKDKATKYITELRNELALTRVPGFAHLKSESQEDKSLMGIPKTDRPNRE